MPIICKVLNALEGVLANAEDALEHLKMLQPEERDGCPTQIMERIMTTGVDDTTETTKLLVEYAAQFERETPIALIYPL